MISGRRIRRISKLDYLYKQANDYSSEESHYVNSKNSDKEIRHFSSENSNFSNFSNEFDMYKKSDGSDRVSYRDSNRSDRTFKDQMIMILEEYKKNFKNKKCKNNIDSIY